MISFKFCQIAPTKLMIAAILLCFLSILNHLKVHPNLRNNLLIILDTSDLLTRQKSLIRPISLLNPFSIQVQSNYKMNTIYSSLELNDRLNLKHPQFQLHYSLENYVQKISFLLKLASLSKRKRIKLIKHLHRQAEYFYFQHYR